MVMNCATLVIQVMPSTERLFYIVQTAPKSMFNVLFRLLNKEVSMVKDFDYLCCQIDWKL